MIPPQSISKMELKALVCGENFEQLQNSQFYISTGLIHLFVVSGAHLLVMRALIQFFFSCFLFFLSSKTQKYLTLFCLFLYTAVCEFNPPVTRSLFVLILSADFFETKLFWPQHAKIVMSGLLSLVFCSDWVSSISLQLSWLIALGGLFNSKIFLKPSALLRLALQSLWIYPTLLLFQNLSPFSLLTQLIFSNFLEFFLFPLALLVLLIPSLSYSFDEIVLGLRHILQLTEIPLMPSAISSDFKSKLIFINWVLIFSLHLAIHLLHMRKERNL